MISIWTNTASDDPCNIYEYSRPGEKIWEFKADEYNEVLVGFDKHPDGEPNEPVFRYSVRLPENQWFMQPDYNEIFWLSIVAVYQERYPECTWGWTNHPHFFNSDTIYGFPGFVPAAPNQWQWYELKNQTDISKDMSFVLFTDPDQCSGCANYNCDDIVDLIDYSGFADDWFWSGQPGGYNNSDLNCDGSVDLSDLKKFAEQWLTGCP